MRTSTNNVGLLLVEISLHSGSAAGLTDWLYKQRAAQTVSIITSVVHRHGGIVAKRLGESLLCTFPKSRSAVTAAQDVLAAVHEAEGSAMSTAGNKKVDLRLVINFGRLTVVAGNISGEVVDVVGLLVSEVEPDTIVATREVVDALPEDMRIGWADRGESRLEGVSTPVRTYELTTAAGEPAPAAAKRPAASAPPAETPAAPPAAPSAPPPADVPGAAPGTLALAQGGQRFTLDTGCTTVRIGRAKDNDLVVPESHVSRNHASVELREDGFYLVNTSVNGTTVVIGGEETLVESGQMLMLVGDGSILLAPAADLAEHDPIIFSVG